MTTMDGWRGVYLAGLLLVPLISVIHSSSEGTSNPKEENASHAPNVTILSASPEPTDTGSSTPGPSTHVPVMAIISTTPSSSLTTTGSVSTKKETTLTVTVTANSNTPQLLTTTTSLVQPISITAGPDSNAIHYTTGYVLLVILMITIVVLCWILVALRRKSRRYSFDLQYPVLLMEPPGTFEMNNMEGLNNVDLSPLPAVNGACLSVPGEGLLSLELPPSSSCLPLDTEQTDKKGDQSDDVSLHITEEEQ